MTKEVSTIVHGFLRDQLITHEWHWDIATKVEHEINTSQYEREAAWLSSVVRWQGPMSVQYGPYKVFLLFLYLRDMLFKNLDDATLSPLGNPHNMQIKAAITENLVLIDISVSTHSIKIILVSIHMF